MQECKSKVPDLVPGTILDEKRHFTTIKRKKKSQQNPSKQRREQDSAAQKHSIWVKPIRRRKPRSTKTPTMKPISFMSYWDTQTPHPSLYSGFSQTGECWRRVVGRGRTHIRWAQGRGVISRTSSRRPSAPDWSYLPASDLGINFVLGDAGCYGRKSLVELAAWKKHMEVDMLRSRRAQNGTEWFLCTTSTEGGLVRGRGTRSMAEWWVHWFSETKQIN